jgi:hypothetical protein
MHCDPARLCEGCLIAEERRLLPAAQNLGRTMADTLARQIVPDDSWISTLDEHSDAIKHHVEPLARDPALRLRLARECARTARAVLVDRLKTEVPP